MKTALCVYVKTLLKYDARRDCARRHHYLPEKKKERSVIESKECVKRGGTHLIHADLSVLVSRYNAIAQLVVHGA